ncbi:hypothetical protein [Kitasatospora sp. NPDC056181]|uniref:hypothetical protein n=1 Tax=Kitasatospora sp. NPDC056181 TaxID=3345737 RepID=UPI0035DCEC62
MAVHLDWRDARHYDHTRTLPCRWCGRPTPLRDEQRRPAHKVCAEQHAHAPVAGPAAPAPATEAHPAAVSPREESMPDSLFTASASTCRHHRGRAA